MALILDQDILSRLVQGWPELVPFDQQMCYEACVDLEQMSADEREEAFAQWKLDVEDWHRLRAHNDGRLF